MPSLRTRFRRSPDRTSHALHAEREAPRLVASMERQAEAIVAEAAADDEGRLRTLLNRAVGKLRRRRGDLGDLRDDLPTLLRLVRAYVRGDYRRIPWRTLTLAVAALLYFVAPLDLLPDVLAGIGFVDDAAVVAYVLKAIQTDLGRFETWERKEERRLERRQRRLLR
ncbi:MAG: YkvA family protein [Bacteroidota bacterium]